MDEWFATTPPTRTARLTSTSTHSCGGRTSSTVATGPPTNENGSPTSGTGSPAIVSKWPTIASSVQTNAKMRPNSASTIDSVALPKVRNVK